MNNNVQIFLLAYSCFQLFGMHSTYPCLLLLLSEIAEILLSTKLNKVFILNYLLVIFIIYSYICGHLYVILDQETIQDFNLVLNLVICCLC